LRGIKYPYKNETSIILFLKWNKWNESVNHKETKIRNKLWWTVVNASWKIDSYGALTNCIDCTMKINQITTKTQLAFCFFLKIAIFFTVKWIVVYLGSCCCYHDWYQLCHCCCFCCHFCCCHCASHCHHSCCSGGVIWFCITPFLRQQIFNICHLQKQYQVHTSTWCDKQVCHCILWQHTTHTDSKKTCYLKCYLSMPYAMKKTHTGSIVVIQVMGEGVCCLGFFFYMVTF